MAFISYTERPILALGSAWEARAGLIWVDFNFLMSQQAPIRWSLNSWAAQANHGHPSGQGDQGGQGGLGGSGGSGYPGCPGGVHGGQCGPGGPDCPGDQS